MARAAVPAAVENITEAAPVADSLDLQHHEVAAFNLMRQSQQAETLPEAEALLRKALGLVPEPGQIRGAIVCMLAARLYSEGHTPDSRSRAFTAADECNRLLPGVPAVQLLAGATRIDTGQAQQGGLMMVAAIRSDPQVVAGIDVSGMQRIFRQLTYANAKPVLGELRLLLVRSGYGKDDSRFFGDLAVEAIADSIRTHSHSDALALLPQVLDPEYGLRMLVDRRFAPIWPMIEQWAGSNLKRQRDTKLAAARAQFQVDGSLANRRVLADAVWNAGKQAEAQALLAEAVDDPKLWDKDRFHISMITARYAKMLLFSGRAEEALTVAAKVNEANPASEYPYAANLMPNLALLLLKAGRNQDALDLLEREHPPEGSLEDAAAFGYYAALRYCAYHRLGRAREAAAQSTLLATRFASNEAAVGIRTTCGADSRTMRNLWITGMSEDETRSRTLVAFYRGMLGIRTLDMTEDFVFGEMVPIDEPLRAAFADFARELPESYLPALRMWVEAVAEEAPAGQGRRP